MKKQLDLDTFGDLIDRFIEENQILLNVAIPAGSNDAILKDNTGAGPVMQFYILLSGLVSAGNELRKFAGELRKFAGLEQESDEWAELTDAILDLVRKDLVEKRADVEKGANE